MSLERKNKYYKRKLREIKLNTVYLQSKFIRLHQKRNETIKKNKLRDQRIIKRNQKRNK